jgi:hypothetical protein
MSNDLDQEIEAYRRRLEAFGIALRRLPLSPWPRVARG